MNFTYARYARCSTEMDEVLSREEAEDLPRKVTPSPDSTEERYISYLIDQCNDIEHIMAEAKITEDADDMTNTLENVKKEYEAKAEKFRELSKKSFRSTIDFQMNLICENSLLISSPLGCLTLSETMEYHRHHVLHHQGSASLPTPSQRCPRHRVGNKQTTRFFHQIHLATFCALERSG
ncbi:Hypothetical predicted protein [Mytilus galloprovincialis]|uniref:Uncharacterized protein n=1 Tax=Mytilus galloprovincialis TaxID=29158 RepID=A0A8B6BFA6_MYTGA|nr:Hypothetical predicted protein [Mytilus galloprovincialis]